jgi:hypothetical protein
MDPSHLHPPQALISMVEVHLPSKPTTILNPLDSRTPSPEDFHVAPAFDPFRAYVLTSQSPGVGLRKSFVYSLDPTVRGDPEGSPDLNFLLLRNFSVRRFLHLEPYFLPECRTLEVAGTATSFVRAFMHYRNNTR